MKGRRVAPPRPTVHRLLLDASIPSYGRGNVLLPGITASPQTASICCLVESDADSRHTRGAGLLCAVLAVQIELLCGSAWLGPVVLAASSDLAERHSNGDQAHRQKSAVFAPVSWLIFRRLH